jgi:hypothetical protein
VAPLLKLEVDNAAVLAALDQLGDRAEIYIKTASKVTADRIAVEARGRIRRSGEPTHGGTHTADRVTVVESYDRSGWVVIVPHPEMPGLPGWLEHGTKFMEAMPALFPSARIEEGPHLRRIAEALQDAIEGVGLGD